MYKEHSILNSKKSAPSVYFHLSIMAKIKVEI